MSPWSHKWSRPRGHATLCRQDLGKGLDAEAPAMKTAAEGHIAQLWAYLEVTHGGVVVGSLESLGKCWGQLGTRVLARSNGFGFENQPTQREQVEMDSWVMLGPSSPGQVTIITFTFSMAFRKRRYMSSLVG